MATSKPISTISYNTTDFLLNVLDSLIYHRKILYYEFIVHHGDTDDKKEHKHLYILPNNSVDVGLFEELFEEPVPLKNRVIIKHIKKVDTYINCNVFYYTRLKKNQFYGNKFKPLDCKTFRVSKKYGDWYWYVLHNKDYLRAKQLERNISYNDSDIYSSDYDFHNTLVLENPLADYCIMGDVALMQYCFKCIRDCVPLSEILLTGYVPLNKVASFKNLYLSIAENSGLNIKDNNISNSKKVDYDKSCDPNFIAYCVRNDIEPIDGDPIFD